MRIKIIIIGLLCVANSAMIFGGSVIWEKSFENKSINGKTEINTCKVNPDTKYELEVKTEGKGELKLYFYDKEMNIPLYGIKCYKLQTGTNPSVFEFYSPGTSAQMKMVLLNGEKQKLVLRGIKLETGSTATINLNPDFNNHSGYDDNVNCEFIKDNGQNLLKIKNTRYSMAISNFIPVKSGENLKIFLRRPNTQKKTIKGRIDYCDCNIGVKLYYYDKNYREMEKSDWYTFYSNWDNDKKPFPYFKTIKVPAGVKYLKYVVSFTATTHADYVSISKVSITK